MRNLGEEFVEAACRFGELLNLVLGVIEQLCPEVYKDRSEPSDNKHNERMVDDPAEHESVKKLRCLAQYQNNVVTERDTEGDDAEIDELFYSGCGAQDDTDTCGDRKVEGAGGMDPVVEEEPHEHGAVNDRSVTVVECLMYVQCP